MSSSFVQFAQKIQGTYLSEMRTQLQGLDQITSELSAENILDLRDDG